MTISSLGGMPEEDRPGLLVARVSRKPSSSSGQPLTILRLTLGFVFILWLMSLAPQTPDDSIIYPAVVAILGIVVYVVFFVRQIKGVYKARYPTLRAVEALILTAAMFLAIFSMIYVILSIDHTDAFSEQLDSFSAYYYSLTVLATVGFGDIAPQTVPARSVTMVQMALDIAFIAVLIRVMGGAAKKALLERSRQEAKASARRDDSSAQSDSP
ncbi:MAG: two pore domain potassium channel family protein [Actinobacteria bacterium]|nr:two pore domain potassium channel family protein [Actinomycetota bacterium]